MAEPESTVVCFTATEGGPDLFVLVDELTARGWHTQPQLSYAGLPASVHLTVTAAVAPRVAEFGPDLTEAVAAARAAGPVRLPAELTALVGALTPDDADPGAGRRPGRRAGSGRRARGCAAAGADGGGEHPARRRAARAARTAAGGVRRAAATSHLVTGAPAATYAPVAYVAAGDRILSGRSSVPGCRSR